VVEDDDRFHVVLFLQYKNGWHSVFKN